MKRNGSLLEEMGMKTFSFRDFKEIFKTGKNTLKSMVKIIVALIKFIFNPTWEGIRVFQKLIVVPVVELVLGNRSSGFIMGKLYSKYFSAKMIEKKNGTPANLLPDLEEINEVTTEYRFIKGITLWFFLLFYYIAINGVFELTDLMKLITVSSTFLAFGFESAWETYVVPFLSSLFTYALDVVALWIFVLMFRFSFVFLREVNRIDENEISDYVSDLIEYNTKKAAEIADEETALIVRQAVLETVAVKQDYLIAHKYDEALSKLQLGKRAIVRKDPEPTKEFDSEAEIETKSKPQIERQDKTDV